MTTKSFRRFKRGAATDAPKKPPVLKQNSTKYQDFQIEGYPELNEVTLSGMYTEIPEGLQRSTTPTGKDWCKFWLFVHGNNGRSKALIRVRAFSGLVRVCEDKLKHGGDGRLLTVKGSLESFEDREGIIHTELCAHHVWFLSDEVEEDIIEEVGGV